MKEMAPAFSSLRQAAAFALLLLVLMALPAIMGKSLLPPREEVYSSEPWVYGPYHVIRHQIFDETSDIDILFIGSSRIMHGVDTQYVQKALSEKLGRNAVVVTVGWTWAGFDALYFISKDLLSHRKVNMIVFTEESRGGNSPHHAVPNWYRVADNASDVAGLPLHFRVAYYVAAIVGMPRNLLSLVVPDIHELTPTGAAATMTHLQAQDPSETLGSLASKWGYDHPDARYPGFVYFTPSATGATPADAVVYSPQTKDLFKFSDDAPIPPLQLYFARKFADLATQHGCKIVCLNVPETADMRSPVVHEKQFWPDVMHADVAMAGIPMAKLFAGQDDADTLKLFLDYQHLNYNGQKYFTPIITPALLHLYETRKNH